MECWKYRRSRGGPGEVGGADPGVGVGDVGDVGPGPGDGGPEPGIGVGGGRAGVGGMSGPATPARLIAGSLVTWTLGKGPILTKDAGGFHERYMTGGLG